MSNEHLSLKQTSVNRPQLYHSNSKQSITASEDYYSASEGPSTDDGHTPSSDNLRSNRRRYSTPPLRRTPDIEEELEPLERTPTAAKPKKGPVTFDDSTFVERPGAISRESSHSTSGVAANTSVLRRPMPSISPSTTPGLDDTPYIRFAIDQLTRDEEVRGSRHYQGVPEDSEASYPVERGISDEGLGYFSGPTQVVSPVQESFLPTATRTEKPLTGEGWRRSEPNSPGVLPRLPGSAAASNRSSVTRRPVPPSPSGLTTPNDPPQISATQRDLQNQRRIDSGFNDSMVQKDIFVPHRPARDSLLFPPLDFLPSILRPLSLLGFTLLCTLMLAGLIFCAVRSLTNDGLWEYQGFGDGRYFIFQYLPTILGMALLMWLFQLQTALQRIAPFIALAADAAQDRSQAAFLDLTPSTFILPNVQYFKAGQTIFGIFSISSWLFLFTIPLLASCFNVRHPGTAQNGAWLWTAVQGAIWATVALYVFLILSLVALFTALRRKQTALKWDPRSLADIIALLERSNVVNEYEGSETFQSRNDFRRTFAEQTPLLGYWHTSKRQNDVFYGLGEPGNATRRYSIENGKIREKAPEQLQKYPLDDPEAGERTFRREGDFSIRMDIRSSKVRLRYLPWYLRDTWVAAWVAITVVLLLAFLIVSFVRDAVSRGFDPLVQAESDSAGFSAANFLYSILPAAIGMLLFLSWQTLDLSFRKLAPYAAMSARDGATAEQSLLLDYSARLPVSVTVVAAANGHYTVAILSFFTLVNAAIPILAGGVFWCQFYLSARSVRVAAHLPGFYALCVFLALYAIFISIIFRSRRRMALPHASNTLSEIISWVYQSPILADRAFARPVTKADLVTRLMGAGWTEKSTFSRSLVALVNPSRQNLAVQRGTSGAYPQDAPTSHGFEHEETDVDADREGEAKRQSLLDPGALRYGFGIYVGRDGTEHLGIDRVKRGSGREMVIYEDTRRSWRS